MSKKEFSKAAIDENVEVFVVYIAFFVNNTPVQTSSDNFSTHWKG